MKMLTNHRRATIIIAAAVGLIIISGAAWAVWSIWLSPDESDSSEQPDTISRDVMRQIQTSNGVLRQYNSDEQTIVIENSEGEAIEFRIAEEVNITRGIASTVVELEDIAVGEPVSVTYTVGDKAVAIWWDNDEMDQSLEESQDE